MGAQGVDREFEGLGKSDQVGAKTALGDGSAGGQRVRRRGPSRIAQAVESGGTQSRPPRNSGHKSIRIQEPIRFAEMRGITRLDAAEWKCFASAQLSRRTSDEFGQGGRPPPMFLRKDVI